MSRELLQQALDVIKSEYSTGGTNKYSPYEVMGALEAELAKPEQTEKLRVADAIELNVATKADRLFAANELRRLHEENETLKKCLFQMQNAAIELAKPEPVVSFTDNDEGLCIQLACDGSYYWQNLSDCDAAKFFVDAYRRLK